VQLFLNFGNTHYFIIEQAKNPSPPVIRKGIHNPVKYFAVFHKERRFDSWAAQSLELNMYSKFGMDLKNRGIFWNNIHEKYPNYKATQEFNLHERIGSLP